MSGRRCTRGALLLEVLLALAIFMMSSLAVTGAMSQSLSGLERTRGRAEASDLACSAMAMIEAGLVNPSALDGPIVWPATMSDTASSESGDWNDATGWVLEIETEPTVVRELTLVEVRAVQAVDGVVAEGGASYTLRRFVRLARAGEDSIGEDGDLIDAAERGSRFSELGGGP